MTGSELESSGFVCDRSVSCATASNARVLLNLFLFLMQTLSLMMACGSRGPVVSVLTVNSKNTSSNFF